MLAKKKLLTFSGDNWLHRIRKPIQYIELMRCYFSSKVKIRSDPNLTTQNVSFTDGKNVSLDNFNVSNHLYIPKASNIVFQPICFDTILDWLMRK